MKIEVLNTQGGSTGRSVVLPDAIFGIEPNEHVMYLAVKSYLAAQRQGTHKAKERGEIAGSTRKIKRQKGTGTARAGSLKNPLFRSGGRVFGPRPRKYSVNLNKKVKTLATSSALSQKAKEGAIKIIEDFTFETPKTKEFVSVLNSMKVEGKTLFVTADHDKNLYLSARNVAGNSIQEARNLNTYEILKGGTLLMTESSIAAINNTLS